MANKTGVTMEIQADVSSSPVDQTSPAGRRLRRRATGRGRRSQKEKRRGQGQKRCGQREKRRGQREKRLEEDEEDEEERKEGVTVKRCWGGGRRRWDKRHYCVFCRRPQVKMARHLLRKHRDQQEVAQASAMATGSRQRHLLLEQLRCRGNYLHNIEVIRQGNGEIVPWRQPSEEVDARNYLPCPLCLGFFLRADLWKHQVSCRRKMNSEPAGVTTADPIGDTTSDPMGDTTSDSTRETTSDPMGDTTSDPAGDTPITNRTVTSTPMMKRPMTSDPGADRPRKRCRVQAAASRLLPVSSGASESCSEVLHRMNQDHVSHQVKSDWLICKYGNRLMGNQDGNQTRYDYISQKLRELGRFLLAAKSLDSNVQSLHDVLAPPRLRLALTAARKASGYRWSRPPLAVKTALKTVCEIAIGESLQDGNWEAAAKTTDFYHLLGRDWDTLGCLTPDPDTVAAVGGAKLKKRSGQQRSEEECKDRGDLRSEVSMVVPSESSNRQTTSTTPPDFRLQTHINGPMASRKVQRRPWSSAEKEAVWRQLGVHVLVQSVPGKDVCLRCLDLEPVLRGRHWKDVKNHVHNQIQSQKKQQFYAQMDHQENQDHQDQSQKKQQYHTQMDHRDHQDQIQKQKKQQFHAHVDHQEDNQSQKKQQYHAQMDHQDQIEKQKKQQFHAHVDHQDHNQGQKKQQYHAQMDHQDQIQKKQHFHTQMDHQDHNQIQSQNKQQYMIQMDHQNQIQKKHLYHTRIDHQDQIQSQKKQLYHPQMDHQDQGLQTGTALDRNTPVLQTTCYVAEGPHRAPEHTLLDRDPPISPYPTPHRALGPHMDGLLSRAGWTEGPLTQNYPISRQLTRNPLQDPPPVEPPNPPF